MYNGNIVLILLRKLVLLLLDSNLLLNTVFVK